MMPALVPVPVRKRRGAEYVVMSPHNSGAAEAGSSAAGMRRTKSSRTVIAVE